MKARRPPEVCPVCGEDVPPKSQACPDCGACYESGWRLDEEPDYDGVDLPDWAYEDDEEKVVRPRFGGRPARDGMHPLWRGTAFIVLLALAWYILRWLWSLFTTPPA